MKRLLAYLHARRIRKIRERIASLEAQISYMQQIANINDKVSGVFVEGMIDRIGLLAALRVRLAELTPRH